MATSSDPSAGSDSKMEALKRLLESRRRGADGASADGAKTDENEDWRPACFPGCGCEDEPKE